MLSRTFCAFDFALSVI